MSLIEEIAGKDEGRARYSSFFEFLTKEIYTDSGLYSFHNHRAFEQMVHDISETFSDGRQDVKLAALKGAQIGASTIGIGVSTFLPSQAEKNLGYFLPTEIFAKRFDKTRFKTTIRKNPFLQAAMREGKFKGSDIVGLKEFRGKFLYTLGLRNIENAISIPLDANIYDEVDVLPEENMEWSDDRIAASDLRFRFFFSVGMMPGLGVDAKFQEGSMTLWNVKCPACGKDDQILEELFPECIKRIDGRWERICIKCGKPYDVESAGRWVDTYPSRRKEGLISYRFPQLIFPAIALPYVMSRWEAAKKKKSKKAKFNCSCLAIPDAGSLMPITDAVLERCRGDYRVSIGKQINPYFAGVDCGDMAHFAAHGLLPDTRKQFFYFEEMDSDEMVERILYLWDALGLSGLVIDAKPLRVEARKIAYAHPKNVWLQDFSGEEPQEKEGEHEGKTFLRITVGRDASLDEFTDLFPTEEGKPGLILLPKKDAESPAILDVVDIHLKNLRKEKKTDARGNTFFQYLKNVPNHFGMAMSSSVLAEMLTEGIRGHIVTDTMPVFTEAQL